MGARGKTQCGYSKRRSHARCLLRLPINGCACCTWLLCKRMARVAYRKRKEAGNVPHSITGRYDASSRNPSKKASIMALIICPVCGGTVSDKATVCFHCGCLLHSGATHKSLTLARIPKLNVFAPRAGAALPHGVHFCTSCGMSVAASSAPALAQPAQPQQAPVRQIAPVPPSPKQKESEVLKCPSCGYTLVTTGERGYSIKWGFLGANSTINRCGKALSVLGLVPLLAYSVSPLRQSLM